MNEDKLVDYMYWQYVLVKEVGIIILIFIFILILILIFILILIHLPFHDTW